MRKTLLLGAVTAMTTLFGCAAGEPASDEPALVSSENTGETSSALVNADFVVTGLARKCIDVGGDAYQAAGAPVFLYGCNGSTAQRLRVFELGDGTHDVSLRSNLGFCLGVRGGAVAAGRALELQPCNPASSAQRFALDGDTIFVGTQASGAAVARDLVVEVDHGRGANRTPLVVGTRELDPAEDFRFGATSFAALLPTSGFKYVMSVGDLDRALAAAHWGSVIEVAPNTDIRIDDATPRGIPAGVTVRSNRRGTAPGSGITRANGEGGALFRIAGDNIRITGLRLTGPSTTSSADPPTVTAIATDTAFRVLVDHNEMSAWTGSAVEVNGGYDVETCFIGSPTAQNVRVIANYIHDNSRRKAGYGVVSGHGGNPYIDGNTFTHNRHAIAADYRGQTSYTAKFNLVTASNEYCDYWGLSCWKEQDFDAHGSDGGDSYQGGSAGYLFEMRSNTFFPSGKNIDIRGTPCNLATIANNVFFNHPSQNAIKNASEIDYRVQISGSIYSPGGPQSVVGDFDGDGTQDDFIGTGAAWFYRPNRSGEWRILNRFSEVPSQLTFGDFDADGRTDVRIVDARGVTQTSWGGSSAWDATVRIIRGPIGPFVPIGREVQP